MSRPLSCIMDEPPMRVRSDKRSRPDEGDLSREEIRTLLQNASDRMRSRDLQERTTASPQGLDEFTEIGERTAAIASLPALRPQQIPLPCVRITAGVAQAETSKAREALERTATREVRRPDVSGASSKDSKNRIDAGPDWFHLPKTNPTPELKRDMQLLKMRGILDPKRFYKKERTNALLPAFSQHGMIIQGPADHHSTRLTKRERKQTLLEQVLADEGAKKRFKSKYDEIQIQKRSGKKAFYKKLKEKRSRGVRNR